MPPCDRIERACQVLTTTGSVELDRGISSEAARCPTGVFATLEKGLERMKESCSVEVRALRACIDPNRFSGSACIGVD